jgi:diguanylate cyclase (GGDEF)-like protein/PAS domain S-box-containing protein
MTSSLAHAPRKYHGIPLWMFVASMLLTVCAWSAWNAYTDYKQIIEQEYRLLEVRARQREASISGSLRSVNLVLGSIIADMPDHPALATANQNRLLKGYLRQLPELRNLLIEDAAGRICAEANESSLGMDASNREYFKHHRDAPVDDGFYISRPFKAFSGVTATTLSRVIRDSQGRFAGVVVASLESGFFDEALKLSVDEPGIQSLLINLDGDILNIAPASDVLGKNLQGGIAFTEHMNSGRPTTRHLNKVKFEQVMKMSIVHNLPGAPLTIIVSRDYDSVMAEWRRLLYSHVAGFLLLATTALFFSWLASQRQHSLFSAQQQIAERELELRTIIETEPECVKQLAVDCTLLQMNRAGLDMIEADSLDQVRGQNVLPIVAAEYRDAFMALTQRVFMGESGKLEFEIHGLRGGHRWLETHAVPLRNPQGQVTALLGVTRDITERKRMEDQVRQLAFFDPLTNLPNRRLLNDRLSQSMATSKRSGCYGALMFLDLDNFKPLNDAHGHVVGDLLLIEAANRLKSCVREMDTVARFGGDEFVVIASELDTDSAESAAQAGIIAEKIRGALSEPYVLTVKHDGQADATIEHHCTASIGVTLFINHESSPDDILKWADTAMYQAKEEGRNSIRFHDSNARPVL